MVRNLLVLTLLFIGAFSFSQNDKDIDILAADICVSLAKANHLPDSVNLDNAIWEHLPSAKLKFHLESEESLDAFIVMLLSRLSKTCPEFYTMLIKDVPQEVLNINYSKPLIKTTKQKAAEITKNNFYYIENGSKVHISVNKGIWTEDYSHNIYAKLYFRWINDFEFELEFIESNHEFRKHYSRIGEIYKYGIFNSEDGIIELWGINSVDNSYSIFKLFPVQ